MVTFEKLQEKDVVEVKKLLHTVWVDTYKNYTLEQIDSITTVWHDPKHLLEEAKNPLYFFGVAKDGEKIVGVITAHRDEEKIKIPRIYILKDYQGRGIGSTFLQQAIAAFTHVNLVELGVEEDNIKALSFYAKHGFSQTDMYEEEVGGQLVTLLVLQKLLDSQKEA